MYTYIYIYIYNMYICVCVSLCLMYINHPSNSPGVSPLGLEVVSLA